MFCRKCGTENNDSAKFCRNCGEPILKNTQKSNKPEKMGLFILIPSIFLICACIGIAIFTIKDKQKVNTKEFQKNMETGQKYLEEMDYEQAAAYFNKAINVDPKQIDAYQGLASAYVGMEDYESAGETYEKAVACVQEEYESEGDLPDGSEELFTEAADYFTEHEEVENNWEIIEKVGQLTEDEEKKEELNNKKEKHDREQAYYDLIQEYQKKYGEGEMKNSRDQKYLGGLCFIKMLDFNKDGKDELVLAYETVGIDKNTKVFPPKYKIEVWDFKDQNVKQVYAGDPYAHDGGTSCLYISRVEEKYYIIAGAADAFKNDYIWGYSGENFEQVTTLEAVFFDEGSYKIDGTDVTREEYDLVIDKWWAEYEEYGLFSGEENEQKSLDATRSTIESLEKTLKIKKNAEVKTEEKKIEETKYKGEEVYKDVLDAYKSAFGNQFKTLDGYYVPTNSELQMLEWSGDGVMYYSLDDVDGNGTEELFIGAAFSGEEVRIYDIWAYNGTNVCRLINDYTLGYRINCIPCNNGILRLEWSGGAKDNGLQYYQISKDGYTCLTIENISRHDGKFYHSMDAVDEISEEEFNAIQDSYTERTLEWKSLIPE